MTPVLILNKTKGHPEAQTTVTTATTIDNETISHECGC